MYFMYVDESGDPGSAYDSSPYFVLCGWIIHESEWNATLTGLKNLRHNLNDQYSLPTSEELHASEIIRPKTETFVRIKKSERIKMLKEVVKSIPSRFPNSRVISVTIDKAGTQSKDIFQSAWRELIYRFDEFLLKNKMDHGIILNDDTNNVKLTGIIREMRRSVHMSSEKILEERKRVTMVLEDTFPKNSKRSYFIQMADVIVFCKRSYDFPKGSTKKYGVDKLYLDLKPIVLNKF